MLKFSLCLCLSVWALAASAAPFQSLPAAVRAKGLVETHSQDPSAVKFANEPDQLTPVEIGDALVYHQRYQAAIAEYAKSPVRTAAVWNGMGVANQMMFNLKEATRCYKQSLRLNPDDPQVLNNLGTVYESMDDYKRADRVYRRALELDPHSALTYKNLGTNLIAQHNYSQGWDAYEKALALDPGIFDTSISPRIGDPAPPHERGAVNYFMALACVRTGQTGCALDYLRHSMNEGFVNPRKVASGSEFAGLRDNPAFQQLLAEQQRSQ
jgi:tetratricopeptide (TPR) repeat protein